MYQNLELAVPAVLGYGSMVEQLTVTGKEASRGRPDGLMHLPT